MKKVARRLKSRKALSPVVASIILIAVTVAVSIAVAAWMGALTFSFMGSESLTVTNVQFVGTSGLANSNNITLSIKNTGTKQATIGLIKVNAGKNLVTTWTGNSTYAPSTGATGTVKIQLTAGYGWITGSQYMITLFDVSGNSLGSTQATA